MQKNTRKTVTLREVAALAGIDIATASRALNGKGYMSQKTRDAALKAAQELGFQPDLRAQQLAKGRSDKTIVLLTDNDLGVITQQAFFINHRLDEIGFEVQLENVPNYVRHYQEKQVALVNRVRRQRPGVVIASAPLAAGALQELKLFVEEGGIVTGCGEKLDLECDQTVFDTKHRAYLATRHLLELGHQKIGLCLHGEVTPDALELAGFSRAMEEFGAPIQNEWIFGGGNYEEGGARLGEAFFKWPKKPTGICIVNDVSASAFVTILCRQGVDVPGDISVVGFDDSMAARYAYVPLTSVSYPLETIGQNVVEFTQSRLKGYKGPPRTVVVPSQLVIRSSTSQYRAKSRSRTRLSTASLTPSDILVAN